MVGKKGTGKSTLLQYLSLNATDCGIMNIKLKPDDLPNIHEFDRLENIAAIKKFAFNELVELVSIKIGTSLRGLLGKNDKKLFDKAVTSGARQHDIVQIGLKNLSKLGSAVAEIDFTKLIPETKYPNIIELKQSIIMHLKGDKFFFVLIDDLDQIATLTDEKSINRIWGVILALKKFSEDFLNIKCILTLRTEIWNLITNDKNNQRDQIDHIKPLVKFLDCGDDEIANIIKKRIEYVENKLKLKKDKQEFSSLFEGHVTHLPSSTEKRL